MSATRKHGLLQSSFLRCLEDWATGRGEVVPEWRFRLTPPGERTRPLVPDVAYISYESLDPLSPAEREMIATYVSSQNGCYYCHHSHGAAAAEHMNGNYELVDQIKVDYTSAQVSDKLKALLAIAGQVQIGGKQVTTRDVERARSLGAVHRFACAACAWRLKR